MDISIKKKPTVYLWSINILIPNWPNPPSLWFQSWGPQLLSGSRSHSHRPGTWAQEQPPGSSPPVQSKVRRHRRQLKGAELRGSEYHLISSSGGKRTFEKRCTVLFRMTSLGRDFTPLTEQCRKEAPPSISTSPVTWYTSSLIWEKNKTYL